MQRFSLLILGVLSLTTACSSGDGFSEDKGNNNNGGGGGNAGAEITSANAMQVTRVSYQSAQAAGAAGDYSGGTGLISSGPVGKIDGSFATANKVSGSTASVPIPPTAESCLASGTVTLSGDITDPLTPTLTAGDWFELAYVNCGDGFAVIDGVLYYEVDAFSGDLAGGSYDLTMFASLTDFQVATDEDTLVSNGDVTVRLNTLDVPVVVTEVSGNTLTVDSDLASQTLRNFSSVHTSDTGLQPAPYTRTSSGTLDTTLLSGTVSYSTPVPFEGFDAGYPGAGEFLVTGANSSARLVVLDDVNIEIDVDVDGDGIVDDTLETTWAEFDAL